MMTRLVTKNCVEMAYDGFHRWLFHQRQMSGLHRDKFEWSRDVLLPAVVTIELKLESPLFKPLTLEQDDLS